MNRKEKLTRMIELADELNDLMQELVVGMDVSLQDLKRRHEALEEIKEDAEFTLSRINFWDKEEE